MADDTWLVWSGRVGLVAKGVLYVTIGLLAFRVAFGGRGEEASHDGAIEAVARQPLGRWLLIVLAAGFAGYAVWRAAQAWLDPRPASRLEGAVLRASLVVRAAIYAGLCVLTVRELRGAGGSSTAQQQSLTRSLMGTSWGPWVVGATGVALVGAGLYQLYRSRPSANRGDIRHGEMDPAERAWAVRAGVVGHLARAAAFSLSGWFLLRVAVRSASEEVVGLDAALRSLAGTAYGRVMLSVVAAGLVAYAGWCWVLARYGRIRSAD